MDGTPYITFDLPPPVQAFVHRSHTIACQGVTDRRLQSPYPHPGPAGQRPPGLLAAPPPGSVLDRFRHFRPTILVLRLYPRRQASRLVKSASLSQRCSVPHPALALKRIPQEKIRGVKECHLGFRHFARIDKIRPPLRSGTTARHRTDRIYPRLCLTLINSGGTLPWKETIPMQT